MSLNGWGGKLCDAVLAYIRDESPDILCLQEVAHTPGTQASWLTYRDGDHILPQRPNFFSEVCAALPGHTAIFCPSAQGLLWDGDRPVASRWGLATFVDARFPITEQAQGFVHGSYSPDSYGEHPRPRGAHAIRVYNYDSGWPVTIAHMHGLRDLRGKFDTPERIEQAHRLSHLTSLVAQPGDRVVVCGDFNVEPDSQTFDILKEAGLTDLVRSRGFSSTRTSHYEKPGRFADYMLVSSNLESAAFAIPEFPEVSDHRPLVLDI